MLPRSLQEFRLNLLRMDGWMGLIRGNYLLFKGLASDYAVIAVWNCGWIITRIIVRRSVSRSASLPVLERP